MNNCVQTGILLVGADLFQQGVELIGNRGTLENSPASHLVTGRVTV